MQVKLRSNSFTATQWNKPGDHPAVHYIHAFDHMGTGYITPAHYEIETVYDYDYMQTEITPGTWIVEMFDGIHLFSDEEFKKLFIDSANAG